MTTTKPFNIPKQEVWKAYLSMKANKGAAGIDGIEIEDFEKNLKNNLYKIWNRMSSGSYLPPPVRTVAIPKSNGGIRKLGIPTVGDRIAQTVVKQYLEPIVDPLFHRDSYGYRPGKSAHDALNTARTRCWRKNWVIDLDIKGFFDNLDHALILRAVRKHTNSAWALLYIERWLKAPSVAEDGMTTLRDRGTPQGSVISPLLANIFLHHAFDTWMEHTFPSVPFERYADDGLAHCVSETQAKFVQEAITKRLALCRLELNREKTRIVYCKDVDRPGSYEHERFDFLGYTFRPRLSKNRWGKCFVNFTPAISSKAVTEISQTIRQWKLHLRSDKSLEDLAHMFNAVVRGWVTYYGRFYPSAMYPVLRHIEHNLIRWVCRKHKRCRRHKTRGRQWLVRIAKREPKLIVHWQLWHKSPVG
jgi:RNA-directed DNA polymerase